MKIIQHTLTIDTADGIDIHDLNPYLRAFCDDSGIRNGLLSITSHHTTTALAINEYESRLIEDVKVFLASMAPADAAYKLSLIHI